MHASEETEGREPLTAQREAAIPVLRPRLPDSERLLPYLRRIDASRTYTNWGPLVSELEQRLSAHWDLADGSVVTASSGTAALVGAILGSVGRATADRPLAIVPAFTFIATAVAAEQCGFEPHIADVDVDDWLLDPDRLLEHPLLHKVGLVIPVAAFGRSIPVDRWRRFQSATRIPVVVDAAACFEAFERDRSHVGDIPLALSFHATKSFAAGEGGCVITSDRVLAERIGQSLNFGFSGTRDSALVSTNGKMSEYHAAVALAELDGWSAKRQSFARVSAGYQTRFRALGRGADFFGLPQVASCYALFRSGTRGEATRVCRRLEEQNIDFRLWYGHGLVQHTRMAAASHDELSGTADIAPRLIGLPVAVDLEDEALDAIVAAVSEGFDT